MRLDAMGSVLEASLSTAQGRVARFDGAKTAKK